MLLSEVVSHLFFEEIHFKGFYRNLFKKRICRAVSSVESMPPRKSSNSLAAVLPKSVLGQKNDKNLFKSSNRKLSSMSDNIVSWEGTELTISQRCTNKPTIITFLDNKNDIIDIQCQFVFFLWNVSKRCSVDLTASRNQISQVVGKSRRRFDTMLFSTDISS